MKNYFKKFLSAKHLYHFCESNWRNFAILSLLILLFTTFWIFAKVPADFQQGEVAKIMYIHVPSAILSLALFLTLGLLGCLYIIFRIKVTTAVMRAITPIGLMLTILVLVTGSIWGKPTWGTWWIWDARLTSELILAFLYLVLFTYDRAMQELESTPFVIATLAIIGSLDLPIIHYSVSWWHTLHQGPSILAFQKPTISWPMLWPLYLMIIAISLMTAAIIMLRCLGIIRAQAKDTQWMLAKGISDVQ